MKPVIIAVAITGSVPRKKDTPAVPVTPTEQIESTHQAFEAGASLVHTHVRNPDESSSSYLRFSLFTHFECDPIPYALETDWPVGAAGFEPLHP